MSIAAPARDGEYLPHRDRRGVALCVSGGGYRAALFHVGALTRLNELGALGRLDTVSAVSGGSILAAFLAQRLQPWPVGQVADWRVRVVDPFRDFTRKNIRTLWALHRILPWRLADSTVAVESLVRRYERDISQLQLRQLPERPRFVFGATDMSFGVNWVSERDRIGSYEAGYVSPAPWSVARAVAASSCFPPVFEPMPVAVEPLQFVGGEFAGHPGPSRRVDERRAETDRLLRGLRLADGGVYDNMALEPVWKTHRLLLVSDGGATFDFKPDSGPVKRLARYQGIQGRQVSAMRKRWLISNFDQGVMTGAYWGIGSTSAHYGRGRPGYSEQLVEEVISEVRTDLDYFSDAEAAVLQNHGYLLADAAMRTHVPELYQSDTSDAAAPYPDWLDEDRVRAALKNSAHRSPVGRWAPIARLRGRA